MKLWVEIEDMKLGADLLEPSNQKQYTGPC